MSTTMEPLQMNIISTSAKDESTVLLDHNSSDSNALEPIAAEYASQVLQLLINVSVAIVTQSYLIFSRLVFASLFVGQQTAMATKSVLADTTRLSQNAALAMWDSAQVRRLRKKLEMEFFTFILGCGNVLCVMMFWPGWWLMAMIVIVICYTIAG
ncbi:hypothetical protein E8E14_009935 [Neopestalotiopsis sp. 37M]|nr:hypothetical protein E8E14_009935 [Neopestalotiopsis sp. 37M]